MTTYTIAFPDLVLLRDVTVACPRCEGKGELHYHNLGGMYLWDGDYEDCTLCAGSGQVSAAVAAEYNEYIPYDGGMTWQASDTCGGDPVNANGATR